MAIPLVVNGATFSFPQQGDVGYAGQVTAWAKALNNGCLQLGGAYTLLSDLDLSTFGVKAPYFTSKTASPATTGSLRLAKTDAVKWRNNIGSADLSLDITAADLLEFNGTLLTGQPFAAYGKTSAGSFGTGATVIIDYNTLEQDTDSAVTTGASWKFTVPAGKGGVYRVSAMLTSTSVNPTANSQMTLKLFKNGSAVKQLAQIFFPTGTAWFPAATGSIDIQLAAADFIDIRLLQNATATMTCTASAAENWVSIKRVA